MDLFPTLFEEYDLTGAPGVDEFHNHIKTKGETSIHSLAVNGVSSHGGWDPLQGKESEQMLITFQQCCNHFCEKMGNWPVVITGSWYNILPKGGRTERHRHEASVISGAYYLDLPEGDFGKFFVESPLQPYMMCVHNVRETPYGQYFYDVPIKEKHLYLFPSWLEHGSRVNNTNEDRWTVSFNTSACAKEMLDPAFVESVWGKGHEDS